jgi:hypothetical protein
MGMRTLLLAIFAVLPIFAQQEPSPNIDRYVYVDAEVCAVLDSLFSEGAPPCQQHIEVYASQPINGDDLIRVTLRYTDENGIDREQVKFADVNPQPDEQTMVVFFNVNNITNIDAEIEDLERSHLRHGLRDQPVSPQSGQ